MQNKDRRPVPPEGLRSDSTAGEFRLLYLRRRAEDADRLEERLKRLEWSGTRVLYDDRNWLRRLVHPSRPLTGNGCPVCQRTPVYGHTDNCWLGLELRPRSPGR